VSTWQQIVPETLEHQSALTESLFPKAEYNSPRLEEQ